MPSFEESIRTLNLPQVEPPELPEAVGLLAKRLEMTVKMTSLSVPEQYEVYRSGHLVGHIHARHGGMSVRSAPPEDRLLYDAGIDGFGGFTDHEREAKMLLAIGLLAANLLGL